jgi:hypothetical protein
MVGAAAEGAAASRSLCAAAAAMRSGDVVVVTEPLLLLPLTPRVGEAGGGGIGGLFGLWLGDVAGDVAHESILVRVAGKPPGAVAAEDLLFPTTALLLLCFHTRFVKEGAMRVAADVFAVLEALLALAALLLEVAAVIVDGLTKVCCCNFCGCFLPGDPVTLLLLADAATGADMAVAELVSLFRDADLLLERLGSEEPPSLLGA